MEELVNVFSDILKKDIAVVMEKLTVCSGGGETEITFEEAKKKVYRNYRGFNIYPIFSEEGQAYLLIGGNEYVYTVETRLVIGALKEKLGEISTEEIIINEVLNGKAIDEDNVGCGELDKKFPFYIGIIDGCTLCEDEVKEILKMTMDCVFITSYNERLVAGFKCEEEELHDKCRSFVQNVMGDVLIQCVFSVGGMVTDIRQIRKTYLKCMKAVEVKNSYGINEQVLFYDEMYEYLIVAGLDDDTKEKLIDRIFDESMIKFLNDEMMATIEEFFKCNLNITETASNLYIHRNTLIYRLDKIYRLCGFDLRHFNSSAVFELAYIAWKERLYGEKK